MSFSASQLLSKYHYLFNNEKTCAETERKLDFISSIGDDDHILGLDKKTYNAYGVIQVYKVSMLLRLLITYRKRRIWILNVVVYLRKNIIKQDTKSFSISKRLGRVFFVNIHKRSKHPFQVYRIIHLLPLNTPYTAVSKV